MRQLLLLVTLLYLSGCTTLHLFGHARLSGGSPLAQLAGPPSVAAAGGIAVGVRNPMTCGTAAEHQACLLHVSIRNSGGDAQLGWQQSSFAEFAAQGHAIVDAIDTDRTVLQVQRGAQLAMDVAVLDVERVGSGTLNLAFYRGSEAFYVTVPFNVDPVSQGGAPPDEAEVATDIDVDPGWIAGCWITGWFYGGSCWFYLGMPYDYQKRDAAEKVKRELRRKYPGVKIGPVEWTSSHF